MTERVRRGEIAYQVQRELAGEVVDDPQAGLAGLFDMTPGGLAGLRRLGLSVVEEC
ncbi:hypothetical protein ACIOHS_12085 [Streptomyces sp. NPDC088253]|uniref:hypothetical protein n=1 Tax=Streptomyces sp. NPDC088253 TaxID=3365846 RepID=UPI00381F7581